MIPCSQKRLVIGLSVATVIFAILAAWGWTRATMREVHAMLADNWTQILQEGRDAAIVSTNVTEIAGTLRWVGRFYRSPEPPSGPERHHYNLMERIRAGYQQDIIGRLRQLTGDQLPNDPKVWIDKYAKPEN